MSQSLVYINSGAIVEFCRAHPVDQCREKKHLVRIGGIGDVMADIPITESFLRGIHHHQGMMTQEDLWNVIQAEPENRTFFGRLTHAQAEGFKIKIYRNFYSSLVDSLHVWALCIENDSFDRCILDSADDSCSKVDVSLYKFNLCTRLALRVDTEHSRHANDYKMRVRGISPYGTKELWLKINGQTLIGGKHWYTWPDIRDVLYAKNQSGIFD